MFKHKIQRWSANNFESVDPLAAAFTQQAKQFYGCAWIAHGDPGCGTRAGQREKFYHGGGYQAQRAFGADEEMLEIVAGIVLAQAAQTVPDAAVGQDNLQAKSQLAHVAVAQHLHPAGIGGQVAADGGRSFGSQRQREQPAGRRSGFLYLLQNAAGFDGHGVVVEIDGANAVHAHQAHQHLALRMAGRSARRCAAHQAGIAALRHDGDTSGGASSHNARHFLGILGPHHAQRAAAVASAPVGEERRHSGSFAKYLRLADDAGKCVDQSVVHLRFQRMANRRPHALDLRAPFGDSLRSAMVIHQPKLSQAW